MLRLKELRRQRDPTSTSATKSVAQRTGKGHRRFVGTLDAVEQHQRQFGRTPRTVAADTGFYSLKNEKTIQRMGVTRVAVPSRSTKSSERRNCKKRVGSSVAPCWRTGCESRISVLKRRHGLNRCRYRGFAGMQRWVGLGVIADNTIQIGRYLAVQRA
jgi:transposase, IS5 family